MTKHYSGWRKSGHSNPDGHCVEVGQSTEGTIGVRDTKLNGTGPTLEFSRGAWRSFLHEIRTEEH